MRQCNVIYEVPFDIEKEIVCLCAQEVMSREGVERDIFIVFVSCDKMKEMNNRFFGRDNATDVLSFPADQKEDYLGEILICPSVLKNKKNIQWEVLHLVAHGAFHLLGQHHEHTEDGYDIIHKKEVEVIDYVMSKR